MLLSVQARYGILLEESAKNGRSGLALAISVGTSSRGVISSESKRVVSTTGLARGSVNETNESLKGTWKKLVLFNSGKGVVKEESAVQALRVSESKRALPDTQDDEKDEPKDLLAAMDSFDNLFCRRCLVWTQHLYSFEFTQLLLWSYSPERGHELSGYISYCCRFLTAGYTAALKL